MKPIVDELETEYRGEVKFVRIDIDTERGKELARQHAFIGQPTFIFFNAEGEEVRRLQGPQTQETLEMVLDQISRDGG